MGIHTCPACDSEECVKGSKVCDRENRWWSYCFADHTGKMPGFPETEPVGGERGKCLWFHWESENVCLIEGPDSGKVIQVQFS